MLERQGEGAEVRLAELIAALSLATDLGSGQPMERALRRCLIAVRLGQSLGLGDNDLRTAYYVALLQYVGCTTEAHKLASIWGDEVATGDWFATVGSGQPIDLLAAMVRHVGAARLTIAERTVHHHVQHIYDKLGVSSRAAASLFAMQHDLLGEFNRTK